MIEVSLRARELLASECDAYTANILRTTKTRFPLVASTAALRAVERALTSDGGSGEVERLREALRPFAEHAKAADAAFKTLDIAPPRDGYAVPVQLALLDKARAALSTGGDGR